MIKLSILLIFLMTQIIGFQVNAAGSKVSEKTSPIIDLAFLHLELRYADLDHNAKLIENGIKLAVANGAKWVLTPELTYTGYRFDLKIGTDWIAEGPDKYVKRIQELSKKYNVTVFLSHLEKDEKAINSAIDQPIYNTLFVINNQGEIIGKHRKINIIPVSESWSTAGQSPAIVNVEGHKVGLLICADAWPTSHTKTLLDNGAEMIVSSASWAPGMYGPGETWEKRSLESGLPLFVNNRTGVERDFDLRESNSVVSFNGKRLLTHISDQSKVVLIKWDNDKKKIIEHKSLILE